MKGLLVLSIMTGLLTWTTAQAAAQNVKPQATKIKTSRDQRFSEFQYISQVKTIQSDRNSEFILVERLGFDTAGSFAKLVLSVVQDQGAGATLVYELPIEQGISPELYGKMKVEGDTLTFTGLKSRAENQVELQEHKIVFERKDDELTGKAVLTSSRVFTRNSWYEFHTE